MGAVIRKPAKAVVDKRGRLIGPVVLDIARAPEVCAARNRELQAKHREYMGDAYVLADCLVEVVG